MKYKLTQNTHIDKMFKQLKYIRIYEHIIKKKISITLCSHTISKATNCFKILVASFRFGIKINYDKINPTMMEMVNLDNP